MTQVKNIQWDDNKEIGITPFGHYANGKLGVMTSKGFVATEQFAVVGPNKQIIAMNADGIATLAGQTETIYANLVQAALVAETPVAPVTTTTDSTAVDAEVVPADATPKTTDPFAPVSPT